MQLRGFAYEAYILASVCCKVEPPAEGQSSNATGCASVEEWKIQTFLVTKLCSEWFDRSYVFRVLQDHDANELWESLNANQNSGWMRTTSWLRKDTYTPDSAKAKMLSISWGLDTTVIQQGNETDIAKRPKPGDSSSRQNMGDENVDMIAHAVYGPTLQLLIIKGEGKCYFEDDSEKELNKDEAIDKFVLYKTEVENQLGRKIKVVRSDRGGEYVSPFAELCAKHGIRHEFTAPYSPQQNGIAERKNRTLKEMVNAMLISSGLSQDMWGEAILTATYLLNKIPPKVVVPTLKAQKIGPKSVDCIFIGYAKNSSAYRFIVHDSINPDIQKNAVTESRNAFFFENIFPCLMKETGSSSRLDEETVQDKRQRDDNDLHDERQDQIEEEEVEPRRSKRARTEKSSGPNFVSFMIIRTHNGLVLSQAHYVDKILNTHNAGDSGLARTPIDTSTRPDLAYVVSRLSRYTSNPSVAHWKAMTRVLHYLRYSRDYGLHYDRYPAVIEGYSDANWISDIKDSRSTSGYVFTLGGAAISWKSSKQTVIAKSTMESEFIALDKCREEAEWLRQFVEDIPRWPKPVTAISIHCDSQSAIGRAHSTMYNGKSRHIRRRHNSIRQLLSTGVISIDYVKSKDNIADPLTKGLSRELVSKSSKGMGLKPLKE
ncbi:pol polyprotein [Tanacetum coccineum]